MSDYGDIVSVLGELDRSIGRLDADRAAQARAAAATLVPPMGDPAAAGWYDRFLRAAGGEPEQGELGQALVRLGGRSESRVVLPHRLMTIGAVARALPERFGPGGTDERLVLEALSAPGILRGAPSIDEEFDEDYRPPISDEAPRFHTLLVDPAALPNVQGYRAFVALAIAGEAVHPDLAGAPPPCAAGVVDVSAEGAVDVAVAIVTRVCVSGLTLADVGASTSFMNPANWTAYSYWCQMVPDPANLADPDAAARFLEVVALDCPRSWFEVAVWLDVSPLVRRPGALTRTYTRSADQRTVVGGVGANDAVDVDEGTIKVTDEGGHLRVTTTKRVHFTAPIDSYALAVIACGAGYGALASQFVVEGTGGLARDVQCAPTDGDQAAMVEDPVRPRVAAVGRSLDECATAAKTSYDKTLAGSYTADDLVGDVTGSIARSVRVWSRLLDLAVAIVQRPEPGGVRSDPVRLRPPATGPSDLELVAPMTSAHGHALPAGRVRFEPPRLAAGTDAFTLVVEPTQLRGTTYFGVTKAVDAATGAERRVDVDVQIP
jgi:hypothetical protein